MNISPSVLEDLSAWHVFVMPIIQSKWCQWKLNAIVHRDLPTCTLGRFKRHFSRVGGIATVRKFCTDYTWFTSRSCLVGETGETKSDWNMLPMFSLPLNLCASKSEMFLKWLIYSSKSLQTSWTCWELLKKKKKKKTSPTRQCLQSWCTPRKMKSVSQVYCEIIQGMLQSFVLFIPESNKQTTYASP